MTGDRHRIIALAHQTEVMARQKYLRPLDHYLKPKKPNTPEEGARGVLAMMKRFKAKQDRERGRQ